MCKEKVDNFAQISPIDFVEQMRQVPDKKAFIDEIIKNDSNVAYLSYWQKWLEMEFPEEGKYFQELMDKRHKEMDYGIDDLPLKLNEKFDEKSLEIIFSNTFAVQLSIGCSKCHKYCALDSAMGVKEHIPFWLLANLYKEHGKDLAKSKAILYFASEPGDYDYDDPVLKEKKTFKDAYNLAVNYGGYKPNITTTKTDSEWLKDFDLSGEGNRISVYGLKEDEIKKVKNTERVNTLEGDGQEMGKGIGYSYMYMEKGKNTFEGNTGIGFCHGVLLTPRGLYNVCQVPISREYPQGQVVIPIKEINNEAIKEGDSFAKLLETSVMAYQPVWDIMFFLPYITLIKKDKAYDIAVGDDGKVRRVVSSGLPYLERLLDMKKEIHNLSKIAKSPEEKKKIQEMFEIVRDKTQEIVSTQTEILRKFHKINKCKLPIMDIDSEELDNVEWEYNESEKGSFLKYIHNDKYYFFGSRISYAILLKIEDENLLQPISWKDKEMVTFREAKKYLNKETKYTTPTIVWRY